MQFIKSSAKKWNLPIDPRWTGFTAIVQPLNITILLTSLIVLLISPSDARTLNNLAIESKILAIFTNVIIPLLALLHQVFAVCAQTYGFAKPLVALLFSITFVLAWGFGALMWCSLFSFNSGLKTFRIVMGALGELGWVAMLVLAAGAVHRERRQKDLVRKGLDSESQAMREKGAEMGYSL